MSGDIKINKIINKIFCFDEKTNKIFLLDNIKKVMNITPRQNETQKKMKEKGAKEL